MKIFVTDRSGGTHVLDSESGEPLMEVLASAYLVEATCGGVCSCATCHVYVDSKWLDQLPAQDEEELELLDALMHTEESSRLACQIQLTDSLDGISVTVAEAE